MQQDDGLCPAATLDPVLELLRMDEEGGLARLASLMRSWPLDPRIHFLQGSVLAGQQRYDEGRRAMARAVEIAPEFALARFQLGFLDLTSGRALDAIAVWTPLTALPEDEPLRVLAEGLTNLAVDNFSEARRLLRKGMALNSQNPVINADMQLVLDEIENLPDRQDDEPARTQDSAPAKTQVPEAEVPPSAVDLLLRQSRMRGGGTRH